MNTQEHKTFNCTTFGFSFPLYKFIQLTNWTITTKIMASTLDYAQVLVTAE